MAQFNSILTNIGLAKISNAIALGRTITLTQMALGDGNGTSVTPTQDQTALVKEVYRAPLSSLDTDPDNPAYVIAELVVPHDQGGWHVREVGVFDDAGDLIAIANFPDTYKPVALEGSARDLIVRLYIEVGNAENIQLTVDGHQVIATRRWAEELFAKKQDLAAPTGGLLLGHNETTVGEELDNHALLLANLEGALDNMAATDVAYSQGSGVQGSTVGSALDFLGRSGKEGIFITPSELGHRIGRLAYRITPGGTAKLVSGLTHCFPKGYLATPENYAALGLKAYFVKANGNNSSDGLSWTTAFASIAVAASKGDADVVFVAAGIYPNGQHLGVYSLSRDLAVHSVGGEVVCISAPSNSTGEWVSTGSPVIYRKGGMPSSIKGVVALNIRDEFGLPYQLPFIAGTDTGQLANQPGYMIIQDGETYSVYVRLPDGSAPLAGQVLPYVIDSMRVAAPSAKFYQTGITYIGGSGGAFSPRQGDSSSIVTSKSCRFTGYHDGDNYQCQDVGLSITINCVAGNTNGKDNFNYHEVNGLAPHFIEINCVGIQASGGATSNGSTSHETCVGFRINCDYGYNAGPGVADVNDARTFNVCVTSRANGESTNAHGFVSQADLMTGEGSVVWLHHCSSGDNAGGDVAARNNGKMYIRDSQYKTKVVDNGGILTAF